MTDTSKHCSQRAQKTRIKRVLLVLAIVTAVLSLILVPLTASAYAGSPYYTPAFYIETDTTFAIVDTASTTAYYETGDGTDPNWSTTWNTDSSPDAFINGGSVIFGGETVNAVAVSVPSMVIGSKRGVNYQTYLSVEPALSNSGECIFTFIYTYDVDGVPTTVRVPLGDVQQTDPTYLLLDYLSNRFLTPTYVYDVAFVFASDYDIISALNFNLPTFSDYCSTFFSGVDADAYNTGYRDGYSEGLDNGYQGGYELGHLDGYREGYSVGETEGYTEGYEEGSNGARFIDWFLDIGDAILGFGLLYMPNGSVVSVGQIIGLVAVVPFLVWFLKLFAGG